MNMMNSGALHQSDLMIDEEIFRWISANQKVNADIESAKYHGLIEYISSGDLFSNEGPAAVDVLVVGAGEGRVEASICQELGFSEINLWVVDVVEPLIVEGGNINEVHYIPHLLDMDADLALNIQVDVLICLGTSRYFISAIDIYSNLVNYVRSGGGVIIDFFELPPMRRANTQIMGDWLRRAWRTSPQQAIVQTEEFAAASRLLSQYLQDVEVIFSRSAGLIGIEAGPIGLQRFIYETIFPFWYKEGFCDTEVAAQLMWSFMSCSCDNSIEMIENFSDKRGIAVENIFDIYTDTHVLIGTMC
jgi:hypothetical protein